MSDSVYSAEHTGLLLVDPYNDFLSHGGKIFPMIETIANDVRLLDNLRATVGAALGLGYLANGGEAVSADWVASGHYEIEVAAERVPARVSLRPFYDPAGERVKC